jgi:biopolymer transport protein ExbB
MNLVSQLKQVLLALHASWIMWILLGLSLISLGIILERALLFLSLRGDVRKLSSDLDTLLRGGRYREALDLMTASRCPEAAAVVAGLRHADLGPVSAEKAMSGALALERMRLERGLAFLGTLGNNAPFVGLLGTVIGVIEAFEVLGTSTVSAASQQNVMAGIAEALVATAVGLFVAIPAVAAFNYFQRRIQSIMTNAEALTDVLLAHLSADEPVSPALPLGTAVVAQGEA